MARRVAGPPPRRAIPPGRKLSIRTPAFWARSRRRGRPASGFRAKSGSPTGMTFAPNEPNMRTAPSPGSRRVRSRTTTSSRGNILGLLGDDFLHDLGGAGADGVEAGVAPEAADGVLGDVAEAAEDLGAVVD